MTAATAFPAQPIEVPADFELVRSSEWAEKVTELNRLERFEKEIERSDRWCASGRLLNAADAIAKPDVPLYDVVAKDGRKAHELLAEDVRAISRAVAKREREARRVLALFKRYAALAEEPCAHCHGTNVDLGSFETRCEDSGRPFDLDEAVRIAEDNDAGECSSPTCVGGFEVGVQNKGERIDSDGLPVGLEW